MLQSLLLRQNSGNDRKDILNKLITDNQIANLKSAFENFWWNKNY